MDLAELKKHIHTRTIHNFYVFAGEEVGIMKEYINQISKVIDKPVEYIDSVSALVERVSRAGLVSRHKVYVVYEDKSFLKAESLWTRLPASVKKDNVILIYPKPDKRNRFFKSCEKFVVTFNLFAPQSLAHFIMKKVSMNEPNATQLAQICECSYSRCMQECDKINSYIGYRQSVSDPITPDMAFRLLLNSGAIYQPIGDITFEVIDDIMARTDVKRIEKRLFQVRTIQEPRLRLFSLLYNNFRALVMYMSLPDKSKADTEAGMSKRDIFVAQKYSNRYSLAEAIRALELIQSIEFGIKTGTIPEEISLDYFIAQVI